MTDRPNGPSLPTGDGDGRPARLRAAAAIHAIFPKRVDILALLPAALAAGAVVAAILPPRSGIAAMAMVLEPHLIIVVVVLLAPLALWRRARTLVVALAVTVLVGGCLFGSEWVSIPGSGAGRHDLSVISWNVQYGTRTPADQAAQLHSVTADLVALLEVEPDASDAIATDAVLAARFPYRALAPRRGAWGLVVLSRYPISAADSTENPSCLDLLVTTPQGRVRVIAAHPVHANIETRTPLRVPLGYDPSDRDAQIARVRTRIDAARAAGDRLLVLGDFNTSPSEPEYAVLSAGLRDTHVQVGQGPGWTWRPSRIDFLPFGFLRIDLQLTAGAIRPASTSIDCSLPGDHCRLFGDYEID
jgi:endonuclease/exonuclease/phosphatase (EEP) superfamily protein YafD